MADDILRLAVDALPDEALVTVDPGGRITFWNKGAERLFGYAREDAVGQPLSAMGLGPSCPSGRGEGDLPAEAQRDGVAWPPRWMRHRNGGATYAQATILPLREHAELVGYAVIARQVPPPGADAGPVAQAAAARIPLLRRLIVVQEEERRRIARDLHDDLGQRLTALRRLLEGAAVDVPPPQVIESALQMVARIDQNLDFIARELRPAALDELGLMQVLTTYIDEWSRHTGVPATLDSSLGAPERLPPEIEACLYRIAQEALRNVAKHAAAHSVNVRLARRGSDIDLAVEDIGVGSERGADRDTMLGLVGMRERVHMVGGSLAIEPTPGGGTTVLARVPMPVGGVEPPPAPGSELAPSVANTGVAASGPVAAGIRSRLQNLQRAVAARDEFIATVAHELRNPISPLTFQVRLALDKTEQMAAAGTPMSIDWFQSQLRGVEQRLHRLLETLDRLLDVSRLSTGRIDLQPEALDLSVVVREVIGTLEAELAVARCPVTLTEDGPTTGVWDRLRIEQICRNLLSNAIRFGAGRSIEVSLTGDRDIATLQVRDHGIGIAPEQQATIFERFERGSGQRSGGFGIGLWIVRNICAAMGGTVSLESAVGNGASFTVRLPRQPET